MANLKLSSPWVIFYREVSAMFGMDKQINVVLDEYHYKLNLYVDNDVKAAAITELLPDHVDFGDVTLNIVVTPSNNADKNSRFMNIVGNDSEHLCNLFNTAFYGNPVMSYCKSASGPFTFPAVYVVFAKEVAQYFTDDISDINGLCSTLYQDIAKDIFREEQGVFYCTDTRGGYESMPF